MLVHLTAAGTFWLFAAVCLTCSLFYMRLMPETKGMTMLEIRTMFLGASARGEAKLKQREKELEANRTTN